MEITGGSTARAFLRASAAYQQGRGDFISTEYPSTYSYQKLDSNSSIITDMPKDIFITYGKNVFSFSLRSQQHVYNHNDVYTH
jgi:hypothetical protein